MIKLRKEVETLWHRPINRIALQLQKIHQLSKESVILSKILKDELDKEYIDLLLHEQIKLSAEIRTLVDEVYKLDIILCSNYETKIHPN